MVDLPTSRYARLACALDIKAKNDRENRKRGYEVQIEGPYPGENAKGQEVIFKAMNNLIFRWMWQKHPIL